MFRKEDVRFPAEGAIQLSAWLFVQERHQAHPLPAITMAHGYGGTQYHGIEPMAAAFAIDGHAAGLRRIVPEAVTDLEAQFAADDSAQLRGEPLATHLIVSEEAGKASSYKAADVVSFYLRQAYERALEPKRLAMIKGWHFDPYLGEFEAASRAAIDATSDQRGERP